MEAIGMPVKIYPDIVGSRPSSFLSFLVVACRLGPVLRRKACLDGADGARYEFGMSKVCFRPLLSSRDHLTVPFSVTIIIPATPLTRLEIFVVGPTKSSRLLVIQAEQQLLIIIGTLSESNGAEGIPDRAARQRFCWPAMVAKATRLSRLDKRCFPARVAGQFV